ncbi:MAG: hypothetical protein LBN21_07160 [Treponema sp.]|jgi:hypothetical protein|nr:hypothetical protein [Treponema sp.]
MKAILKGSQTVSRRFGTGLIITLLVLAVSCTDTAKPDPLEEARKRLATEIAEQVVEQLVASQISPAQPAAANPVVPSEVGSSAYKIGNTGPGGGLVFSANDGTYKEITRPENAVVYNDASRSSRTNSKPEGWTLATMPDLMEVYNVLRSKADFGDGWYISSSYRTYRGGTDYSRDHASLSSGRSDYDRARAMFPDASFVLAEGGPDSSHFIRFTDGRIILVADDEGFHFENHDENGVFTGITYFDYRLLYVRAWKE